MFIVLFFWYHAACGILVLQPRIEFVPPALEAWTFNHWTENSLLLYFDGNFCSDECFSVRWG